MTAKADFYSTISAAIADIAARGYDTEARVAFWISQIREAAERTLTPQHELAEALNRVFGSTYQRMVDHNGLLRFHPGISRFAFDKVKPQLRAELDRRIMASAGLIKLNRDAAIEKTVQRFTGWATSVPPGGSKAVDKRKETSDARKPLARLPFEERRVLIDQGHKFVAELSNTLARDGGAIAAEWRHHHVNTPRPEHLARNGTIFVIRDSWAHKAGLVRAVDGYTDSIERPGEFVFCRCTYRYLYNLRDLPTAMLTTKGKEALLATRKAFAA